MDSKYYYGESNCSDKDQFSKRIGRAISLGRAMVDYSNDKSVKNDDMPEDLQFIDGTKVLKNEKS